MVAVLVVAAGCGDAEPAKLRSQDVLGRICSRDNDCQGGQCIGNDCTLACTQDADCIAENPLIIRVCGIADNGQQMCVPSCDLNGFVCQDGVSTSCEVADDMFCEECGCADGLRCDPGVGCVAQSDVGGPCEIDGDCASDNCSDYWNVCRVPVGSACTVDDCDLCQTFGDWSYCSASCFSEYDCNGGGCTFRAGGRAGVCRPTCVPGATSGCGVDFGACVEFEDGPNVVHYCICDQTGTRCTIESAPRPLGAPCTQDSQCEEQCYKATGDVGWCTQTCASDADCGADLTCVNVECVGATPLCGAKCMPPCASSLDCALGQACRPMESVGASGSANVCDTRRERGDTCAVWDDCGVGLCCDFAFAECIEPPCS